MAVLHGADELLHLGDSANVFRTIRFGKTEIRTQAMAHIVAIENVGSCPHHVQTFFQGVGNGGFPGSGQPGKPENHATVTIQCFPTFPGNGGVMPYHVTAFHCH